MSKIITLVAPIIRVPVAKEGKRNGVPDSSVVVNKFEVSCYHLTITCLVHLRRRRKSRKKMPAPHLRAVVHKDQYLAPKNWHILGLCQKHEVRLGKLEIQWKVEIIQTLLVLGSTKGLAVKLNFQWWPSQVWWEHTRNNYSKNILRNVKS